MIADDREGSEPEAAGRDEAEGAEVDDGRAAVPGFWHETAITDGLKAHLRSIEFTVCALMRMKEAGEPTLHNVITFARITKAPGPKPREYVTDRPISVPKTDHSFVAIRQTVPLAEGLRILALGESKLRLRQPGGTAVSTLFGPGTWIPPRFRGRGDVDGPQWLPFSLDPFWLAEYWASSPLLQDLHEPARKRIAAELHRCLGRHIPPRRWGNLVVTVADGRFWTSAFSPPGPFLVVEIKKKEECRGQDFVVVARSRRFQRAEHRHLHTVSLGGSIMPYPDAVVEEDIEIYERDSGALIDSHSGPQFRGVGMSIDLGGQPTAARADFLPVPRDVQFSFVARTRSMTHLPGRHAWEQELEEEESEANLHDLRVSGRLITYLGAVNDNAEADRQRAVRNLRAIIGRPTEQLYIWDVYFGPKEAVTFLTAVKDPRTKIRVLTSRRGVKANARLDAEAEAAAAPVQPDALRSCLEFLRRPGGKPGFSDIDFRYGRARREHDRFVITDDQCFLLGCSLNRIGAVCSIVVQIPDRDAVLRAFESAWNRAGLL